MRETHDEAVRACKAAIAHSQGIDEQSKAMDLLDKVMAARIATRRKAEEAERAAAAERRREAEEEARVQAILDKFKTMTSREASL